MIDTKNLTGKFGNLATVENLTLHVDEGEGLGLLVNPNSGICPDLMFHIQLVDCMKKGVVDLANKD